MAKKGMQLQFVAPENRPERLVTAAEILFEDGPLERTKLGRLQPLEESRRGHTTFPSRAFGAGSEPIFSTTSAASTARRNGPQDALRPAGPTDRGRWWLFAEYGDIKGSHVANPRVADRIVNPDFPPKKLPYSVPPRFPPAKKRGPRGPLETSRMLLKRRWSGREDLNLRLLGPEPKKSPFSARLNSFQDVS